MALHFALFSGKSRWLFFLACVTALNKTLQSIVECFQAWDSCLRGKSWDNRSLSISQHYYCDSLFPKVRPPLVPVTQTRVHQFLTRTMKSALITSHSCWSSELTLKFDCFVGLSVVYVLDLMTLPGSKVHTWCMTMYQNKQTQSHEGKIAQAL